MDSLDAKLQHNSLVLIDIAKMIDETPYGSITFTLRMHDGFCTDIMEQNYQRKRYEIKKKD